MSGQAKGAKKGGRTTPRKTAVRKGDPKTAKKAEADKPGTTKITDRMFFWILILLPSILFMSDALSNQNWVIVGLTLILSMVSWSQIIRITTKGSIDRKERLVKAEEIHPKDQGEYLRPKR